MDLDEQYDKIYRYCFFRLRQRETAEDITQETFLRFFESTTYRNTGQALRYLYT
ncbi:MAG: RNA polymerase subunit sigma-24, partial [Acetatifactor sp.]|nr:RNA polymerase subunit sigma-24 [Acetatifactor sp.]